MSKQYKFGIITALALGLCLAAGSAHAIMEAFRVGNSTGESLNVGCSSTSYDELANGSSSDKVCNDTIYVELTSGSSTTAYTVTYECASNEVQGVSAALGTNDGELDLTKGCTYN